MLVKLITIEDEFYAEQQKEYLMSIQENIWSAGINFTWEFDEEKTIHARHIVTNNGWKTKQQCKRNRRRFRLIKSVS